MALALDSGCSGGEIRPQPLRVPVGSAPRFVKVKVSADAAPVRVPLEEDVRGTILSEFAPPSGDPADVERMLEVQAVIARTYATAHVGRHQRDGYDLCSTTHCQLYQPGRLKTSSWADSRLKRARTRPRKSSGSTAPRRARSFTQTAADTPVPRPTSGAARRAPISRGSPTMVPPGARMSPGAMRWAGTSSWRRSTPPPGRVSASFSTTSRLQSVTAADERRSSS